MVTIAQAVRQVKDDLPSLITPILDRALKAHPQFTWRQRIFNPLSLLMLFITQVMHGNTAITHLRHLLPLRFTAAAYCKARMRLPLTLIQMVCQGVTDQLNTINTNTLLWRGHRVWYADATSFSMPDTAPLRDKFGQPGAQKTGCGFPVSTMLVLCDAAGFILKTLAMPLRTHDASQLHKLHDQLQRGDVLVYDRAGCSYTHLALLLMRNLHGIIRLHQKQIVNFRAGRKCVRALPKSKRKGQPTSRWVKKLGSYDQLVQWYKPDLRPKWMAQEEYDALPDSIYLRELAYPILRKGFRTKRVFLVTTLLEPDQYSQGELSQQYLNRWQIELNFRHLKQTMKMDVLKCKTTDGVSKELAIFVLVYNLVRLVMLGESERRDIPLDRISFVDALRWLCSVREGREVIDLLVNPKRQGRLEPRLVKRRPKSYALLTRPRAEVRKHMENAGNAA